MALTETRLNKELRKILKEAKGKYDRIESCIACSVVPGINKSIEREITKTLGIKVVFVPSIRAAI